MSVFGNIAIITEIQYRYEGEAISELWVKVEGSPTKALEKAHELCGVVLGGAPWHFVSLEFDPPDEIDMPDSDREWTLTAKANFK